MIRALVSRSIVPAGALRVRSATAVLAILADPPVGAVAVVPIRTFTAVPIAFSPEPARLSGVRPERLRMRAWSSSMNLQRHGLSFGATRIAIGVMAHVVLSVNSALGQSADVVRFTDGSELTGRVAREAYAGLELELRRGVKRKISWNEVDEVRFSAGAQALEAEHAAEVEGRIDDARAQLLGLAANDRARRPLRQEALFRLVAIETAHGRHDDAIAHLRELLAKFPDGRYLGESTEALVDLLIEKPAVDEAARELESARVNARSAGVDSRFEAVAVALRGRIDETRGNLAEARADYDAALRDGVLDAGLAARTELGVARCFQGQGDVAGARERFRKLTMMDVPHLVLAGAWNGLADLALDEGVRRRDREQIDVALYSYLRGVVLYLPEEGEPRREHDRAISGAARAFDYVGQIETDPQKKQLARARALMLRRTLPKK